MRLPCSGLMTLKSIKVFSSSSLNIEIGEDDNNLKSLIFSNLSLG